MSDATAVLAQMPKVELNVHLAGTIARDRAVTLARRNGARELLELTEAQIDAPRSLEEFLFVYDAIGHCLRTPDDLRRTIRSHLTASAALGVLHTELLWSPMVHLDDGIAYRAQVEGLRAGIAEAHAATGITCRLLATIDRERSPEDGQALLDLVLDDGDELVVGIGLAYGERLSAAQFAPVFERAASAGLHLTAFAGETGDPRDVARCVDLLGCRRISHGYAVLRNRRLTARARREGVHFAVCPAAVTRLRRWEDPDLAGVAEMAAAGLSVSVTGNNPAQYRTDIVHELAAAHTDGLSLERLATTVDDAVAAAFLDETDRAGLRSRVAARRAASST